jgi:hypothetical protein
MTFTRFFTIHQIYHSWIHPLHHSPLSPPLPVIVSTGLIFTFTHMCTWNLHHIHPPTPFPHHFPPPMGTQSPDRTCSALLFSNFVKEEKWHFCLFKMATLGVSVWYFRVYMYYSPIWLIYSIFLLLLWHRNLAGDPRPLPIGNISYTKILSVICRYTNISTREEGWGPECWLYLVKTMSKSFLVRIESTVE